MAHDECDKFGSATPEAHGACEAVQGMIREHILATKDGRLFSLMHLLGQASLRMEQVLWPKAFEQMTRAVEDAVLEADNPATKWFSQEFVSKEMDDLKAAISESVPAGNQTQELGSEGCDKK